MSGSGAGCSLQQLLQGAQLGYFWLSGATLRSYAAWELTGQGQMSEGLAAYHYDCTQRLSARFWHAEVSVPPDFLESWMPPGRAHLHWAAALHFSAERRSMAFCAPRNCTVAAVRTRVAALHLLVEIMAVQSGMSSVEVLRALQAKAKAGTIALRRWLRTDFARLRRGLTVAVEDVTEASGPVVDCPPEAAAAPLLIFTGRVRAGRGGRLAQEQDALRDLAAAHLECASRLGGRLWAAAAAGDGGGGASGEAAICLPRACAPTAAAAALRAAGGATAAAAAGQSEVWELGAWQELRLAWVILGAAGCGTTSLAANLHQHPELELLHTDALLEDHSFFQSRLRHPFLLPTRMEVVRFNNWATKVPHVADGTAPRLRGIKRPQYLLDDEALLRLSQVRGVRALVLVADPALRAEREYLKNFGRCSIWNASFRPPALGACLDRPCMPRCTLSPAGGDGAGSPPFAVELEPFRTAAHVRRAAELLGEQWVFLADRSELAGGRAFYERAARFAGAARPFPDDMPVAGSNEASGSLRPTPALRAALLRRGGRRGAAAHAAGMAALRGHFSGERAALRDLFRHLPPHRSLDQWPSWLKGD